METIKLADNKVIIHISEIRLIVEPTQRFFEWVLLCEKENPRLGLGFQKAFSVVLKKLFRGAKIFLVPQ
ncbi:hypothetical protein, partial [Metabacillus niabensis]